MALFGKDWIWEMRQREVSRTNKTCTEAGNTKGARCACGLLLLSLFWRVGWLRASRKS